MLGVAVSIMSSCSFELLWMPHNPCLSVHRYRTIWLSGCYNDSFDNYKRVWLQRGLHRFNSALIRRILLYRTCAVDCIYGHSYPVRSSDTFRLSFWGEKWEMIKIPFLYLAIAKTLDRFLFGIFYFFGIWKTMFYFFTAVYNFLWFVLFSLCFSAELCYPLFFFLNNIFMKSVPI